MGSKSSSLIPAPLLSAASITSFFQFTPGIILPSVLRQEFNGI
jgi:hypothetical protein